MRKIIFVIFTSLLIVPNLGSHYQDKEFFSRYVAPDILLIFDVSGSMTYNMAGTMTRGDGSVGGDTRYLGYEVQNPFFGYRSGWGPPVGSNLYGDRSRMRICKDAICAALDEFGGQVRWGIGHFKMDNSYDASYSLNFYQMFYYRFGSWQSTLPTLQMYGAGSTDAKDQLQVLFTMSEADGGSSHINNIKRRIDSENLSYNDQDELRAGCWTPIAPALRGARYWYINEELKTEEYEEERCRRHFVILLTDGEPTLCIDTLADGSTIDGEFAPLGATNVNSPERFKEQCYEEAAALRETIKGTDTFDIQTFVIGVGTSDLETTMNGIAAAGGTDHYYYAGSQEDVLQALRDILAEIVRRARAFSGGEVTSIEEEFISTEFEARMYLASFFATGGSIYEGHLRALRLVEGAIVLDSIPDSLVIWNAADNLASRDPRTRNIYGIKGGSLLEFNNSNFDSADIDVSSGADVDTVINLVRCGRETLDTTVAYLGDIFHSAPIRLGSPNYFYHDDDFDKFRDTINKTRPSVIYAGSNTGLLHAFLDTSGEELFAVVPENFVSQVKALRDTHRFYVDADPMAADVWFPENSTDTFKDWDEWKTVLMAAQGEGGRGITCLDVTDPNNPSHLFSFEHDTMGLTTSVPIMYKVQRIIGAADTVERFFAFFGGGECPDSLYDMYDPLSSDPLKGNVIIALDIYEASIDSLSASDYWYIQPASGDEDKMIFPFAAAANVVNVNPKEDNIYDLLYITDLAGQLWKVDLRDPDVSTWSAKCIFQPPIPTSSAQDKPSQNPAQPSFFRPLIERDPTYGCFWVFYGTGDRSHVFKEDVSNRFYAMMDTVDSTESYPLSESDLLKVSDGGSFDPINDFPDYKGWYLEYDDYTDRDDEKTVSHATLLMDTVKFATFSPIEASDPCEPGGGEATEYIFHFRTGTGRYRSMGTGIPQAPRYSFNLEGGGFEIHQTSDVISIERKSGYGALKKVLQWKER